MELPHWIFDLAARDPGWYRGDRVTCKHELESVPDFKKGLGLEQYRGQVQGAIDEATRFLPGPCMPAKSGCRGWAQQNPGCGAQGWPRLNTGGSMQGAGSWPCLNSLSRTRVPVTIKQQGVGTLARGWLQTLFSSLLASYLLLPPPGEHSKNLWFGWTWNLWFCEHCLNL